MRARRRSAHEGEMTNGRARAVNYLLVVKKNECRKTGNGGERDPAKSPRIRRFATARARSHAALRPRYAGAPREQMTYRTDDGGRSGLSFIQPKSIDEVRKRSRMMAAWAAISAAGMLGRTPRLPQWPSIRRDGGGARLLHRQRSRASAITSRTTTSKHASTTGARPIPSSTRAPAARRDGPAIPMRNSHCGSSKGPARESSSRGRGCWRRWRRSRKSCWCFLRRC